LTHSITWLTPDKLRPSDSSLKGPGSFKQCEKTIKKSHGATKDKKGLQTKSEKPQGGKGQGTKNGKLEEIAWFTLQVQILRNV